MKVRAILFVLFMWGTTIARSEVVVVSKSQFPVHFRSPADFDMQQEEWLVNITDSTLLLGGGSRGTLYSTYHFLEDVCGVRWWTPWGEESVPSEMTAIGNLTLAGIPAFSYRENYWTADGLERPFYARNRSNGNSTYLGVNYGWNETYGPPHIVHTFGLYVPADEYFSSHPEYYALVDGVRKNTQLDYSNEGVYQIVLTKLTQYIAQDQAAALAGGNPMPRYYDLSQNDNLDYCQCPTCSALMQAQGNAPSGPLINFVNRVARAIKPLYPDVKLSTLAYQTTQQPPTTLQVEDNVTVTIAGADNNFAIPFSDNIPYAGHVQGWKNLAKHISLWHYQTSYGENAAHNFVTSNLATDLRFSRDHKVEAVFIEHENFKFPEVTWEMDAWVSMKLMENPDLSINDLIDTFCSGYYGSAAGSAVRQYVSQIQAAASTSSDVHSFDSVVSDFSYINCAFVAAAHQNWAAAQAGATGTHLQRVKNARLGFDRYVLHSAQRLLDEYAAAHGGSVANFSTEVINLQQAAQRSIVILNNLPADRFDSASFTPALINAEIADMNRFIQLFATPSANPVLPWQITDSTAHFVYHPCDLRLNTSSNDLSLVKDPLTGIQAVRISPRSHIGGIYNWVTPSAGWTFSFPAITNKTYQWVELGSGLVGQTEYLHLLDSWKIQLDYTSKVAATGLSHGTFWGEFRVGSPGEMYLNRMAVTFYHDYGLGDDMATPAGDGITNLMKYALNLDPETDGTRGLPVSTIIPNGPDTFLGLVHARAISATDITYAVEVSGDLLTWHSGAAHTAPVSVTNNPDGITQTVVVRDLTSVNSVPRRFIRLRVTRP